MQFQTNKNESMTIIHGGNMEFKDILNIENEEDRVNAIYNIFNEDERFSSKASRIEFLTNIRQIEKHLKQDMKILDLGAGTGVYSLYFASKGYDLTAIELVNKHVELIKSKKSDGMNLKVIQGNALDLCDVLDNYFDIVLCFGPLYHLREINDRIKCINEVKKVCNNDGIMFFAFINNDMVIATETMCYNTDLKGDHYDHKTHKVVDFPFVFSTAEQVRSLMNHCGLQIIGEIASDGLSELLADKISVLDDESYKLWLNYHFYCCEKPEFLGASNHILFVTKK